MDAIKIKLFLFFLVIHFFCAAQKLKSAEKPNDFFFLEGKISLDSLTRFIHKQSGIRFSFNATKVKPATIISFEKGTYNLDDLIKYISKTTQLQATVFSGYIVFKAPDNPKPVAVKKKIRRNLFLVDSLRHKKQVVLTKINTNSETDTKYNKLERCIIISKRDSAIELYSNRYFLENLQPLKEINGERFYFQPQAVRYNVSSAKGKADSLFPVDTNQIEKIRSEIVKQNKFYLFWEHFNFNYTSTSNFYNDRFDAQNILSLLLPGVEMTIVRNKFINVSVFTKPFAVYYTPAKVSVTSFVSSNPSDSFFRSKTTGIYRLTGFYGGVQCEKYFSNKTSIGLAFNYHQNTNIWFKQSTKYELSSGTQIVDSFYAKNRFSADWLSEKKYFVSAKLEFRMQVGKVDFGVNSLLPLTYTASQKTSLIEQSNILLFLRIKLK